MSTDLRVWSLGTMKQVQLRQLTRLMVMLLVSTSSWCRVSANPANDPTSLELLKNICKEPAEKSFRDSLTSVEQVRRLIASYKAGNDHLCNLKFSPAFLELELVISDELANDVCGLETYKQVRRFHRRFVSYYTPEASEAELKELKSRENNNLEPIPEALRRFFVVYVLQVSSVCKRTLWRRFKDELSSLVTETELNVMRQTKNLEAELNGEEYREKASQLRDLQIGDQRTPEELKATSSEQRKNGSGSDEGAIEPVDVQRDKLYIQVPFNDPLKRAKDLCELKFRPIYQEIFLPVVRLANLGYNEHTNSKHEDEQLTNNKDLRDWYRIIEFCEVLKDIDVIEDNSSANALVDLMLAERELADSSIAGTGSKSASKARAKMRAAKPQLSNQNRISILTRDQAIELKNKIAIDTEIHGSVSSFHLEEIKVTHESCKFGARLWLSEPADRKRELTEFERRLKTLVSRKTDFLYQIGQKLRLKLKAWFSRHKQEFNFQDGNSSFGRLAIFLEQHKTEIRVAGLIVGLIIAGSLNLG